MEVFKKKPNSPGIKGMQRWIWKPEKRNSSPNIQKEKLMGERKNTWNLERWKVILEYDKRTTRKEQRRGGRSIYI